jgi:hypothetical protein
MKIFLVFIIALIAAYPLFSAEEVERSAVPSPVIESFGKAFPEAGNISYFRDDAGDLPVYSIHFIVADFKMIIYYSDQGQIMKFEEGIDYKSLPRKALDAIRKDFPGYSIPETYKVSRQGTHVGYRVLLKKGEEKQSMEFDTEGQPKN